MNRLTGIARFEQGIRNSRCIAVCGPIASADEASDFRAEHGAPGCRHVCNTWRLGQRVRFDDAGELHALAEKRATLKLDEHWRDDGLELVEELPVATQGAFVAELTARTRGRARVRQVAADRDL